MKVKKAEITAFLSLIVVLLISFIFGIIEITVIQTEKNLSRICADGAIFSVFGEYESQLMEAYHIFGLDGSYGTGEFNEDKIIGRMHYYSNKNIDYKINGIQYLTDNKGQAFREQVLTYMEQKYGIGLIEDLAGRTSVWEEESIQMSYIMPLFFSLFVIIIHTVFYYHDKAIIGGAAAESAVMGAQYVRRYDKNYDIEALFQEKIHGKLIYMTDVNVIAEVNKEEVQVFAEAKRSFMKTNVKRTADIVNPEKKIRLLK